MKSTLRPALLLCLLFAFVSTSFAGDLTFLTDATATINGVQYKYKAYIDLSSRHTEDGYSTVNLYSRFDPTISLQGYTGIRWWKNTFQADCSKNVKRLTYIAYLDSDSKVIVDQKIADDPWLPFDSAEVNSKVKPYVCQ